MNWILFEMKNIPLILCGLFYSVLCIFSIVTGLIYMSGKKELNPLELPDRFVHKLEDEHKKGRFTITMGFVTFVVGFVQGLTAFSIFHGHSPVYYWIALGFTVFSVLSVSVKLKGKINAFPLMKSVFYVMILVILLLKSSRALFF